MLVRFFGQINNVVDCKRFKHVHKLLIQLKLFSQWNLRWIKGYAKVYGNQYMCLGIYVSIYVKILLIYVKILLKYINIFDKKMCHAKYMSINVHTCVKLDMCQARYVAS